MWTSDAARFARCSVLHTTWFPPPHKFLAKLSLLLFALRFTRGVYPTRRHIFQLPRFHVQCIAMSGIHIPPGSGESHERSRRFQRFRDPRGVPEILRFHFPGVSRVRGDAESSLSLPGEAVPQGGIRQELRAPGEGGLKGFKRNKTGQERCVSDDHGWGDTMGCGFPIIYVSRETFGSQEAYSVLDSACVVPTKHLEVMSRTVKWDINSGVQDRRRFAGSLRYRAFYCCDLLGRSTRVHQQLACER